MASTAAWICAWLDMFERVVAINNTTQIDLQGQAASESDGHRHISLAALQRLRLDAVWWLVSPQNPLNDEFEVFWIDVSVAKPQVMRSTVTNYRRPKVSRVQAVTAEANSENEHLKTTIGELRDTLEALHAENDENVQAAVADANGEILQLKATVEALRDELEQMRHDGAEAVQVAVAGANDEIGQHKGTIGALRDEIERGKGAHDESVQRLRRDFRDESNQQQQTIAMLRVELETHDAE